MQDYNTDYSNYQHLYDAHALDLSSIQDEERRDFEIAIRLSALNGEEIARRAFAHAGILAERGRRYVDGLFERSRGIIAARYAQATAKAGAKAELAAWKDVEAKAWELKNAVEEEERIRQEEENTFGPRPGA